jgi:hypothetical protein
MDIQFGLIIIILIIILSILYKNKNKNERILKICRKDDLQCRMYNHRDINTKCTRLCKEENLKFNFTGNLQENNNEYICECVYIQEPFTLDFTNVGQNPDILPDTIPDDTKLLDRNYLEPFTLDFTNVGENPDILPDTIPDDTKFSDRNYLEDTQQKRYHSLIFG